MEAQVQRSGTVTFLITDLVGSTEQLERLGDEEAISITTKMLARLREAATQYGGEVVKTMGDGLMVVFTSALDAITCAVSMQQAVCPDEPNQDPRRQLPLRIGVHAGEPVRVESEYLGTPVVVAFRLCSTAGGGQIVVSDVVRELVASRGRFAFRDLGERALSGLRAPARVWEVAWKAAEAPPAAHTPQVTNATREPHTPTTDRAPDTAVILFADIVDSVPHTERLGDAMFRERARELDGLLRTHVREHRGAMVDGKLVGDGIVATFPSARSAIMCALQCGALSASVELELHLGIHAGDVIRDGSNIYGGAVNIASRISAATKAGEILVSETIRGLARTSGGVSFEDRGEYMLKGIQEPMRLFTVRM